MYSYYGWLSSSSGKSVEELKKGVPYFDGPMSIERVNGQVHVSFSGNPNRDRGELENTLGYILGKGFMFHGTIYINDANSQKNNEYAVLKVFKDSVTESKDKIFSKMELNEIFL